MEKGGEIITNYGSRIKAEARSHGLKNDAMAEILHYSWGKTVSDIYSGKRKLTEDRLNTLTKLWGVRKNYLRGIDDWRTDADMLKYAHIDDVKAFSACREYLHTIGIDLEQVITARFFDGRDFVDNLDWIYPYLTDDWQEDIDNNRNDLMNWLNENWYNREVTLRRPLDGTVSNWYDNVGKEPNDNADLFETRNCSSLKESLTYYSTFDIYYKGSWYGNYEIIDIQKFMKSIDALTKCVLENTFHESDMSSEI